MSAVCTPVDGIDLDFLRHFLESLEEVENAATGYGRFVSGKIVAEDNGRLVAAEWDGNHWLVSFP